MIFKRLLIWTACIAAVVMMFAAAGAAQERRRQITAVAQGTSTQMGRIVNLNFYINEISTPEDQKILLEAFRADGSRGIANALDKMHSKGRISLTGTVGYDVNYIREFVMPDGSRKIRFVTDRPITFGEHWHGSRSRDYEMTMGEIILTSNDDNSTGTIIPAAKFKLDKENELTIEAFRNPWRLINIKLYD